MQKKSFACLSLLIFISLIAGGCSLINRIGLNTVSVEEEAAWGDELASQVELEFKSRDMLHKDPMVDRYINQLGHRLVDALPAKEFHYTFGVVKTPVVNAFSLPGGHVYVHTGLIAEVENEAELAGVIAHEMGHVVARHATERLTAAVAAQSAGDAIVRSRDSAWGKAVTTLAVEIVGTGGMLAYSRRAEEEADLIGTDILIKAGYDPRALGNFYTRLENKTGGKSRAEVFFSTHPDPGEREKNIAAHLKDLHLTAKPPIDTPEFDGIRKRVAKYEYPEEETGSALLP